MPELPEVETVVCELRPLLIGRQVVAVNYSGHALRRSWTTEAVDALRRTRLHRVERRGKWILVWCQDRQLLRFHLGMTGQLTVVDCDQPCPDHVHWWADLDNGRQWRFRDIRRFGCVEWFADGQQAVADMERQLGPEPLQLAAGYLQQRVGQSQRCLKAVLLDQKVVAGIGNIYADEALFAAGLHPGRPAATLSAAEWEKLRVAIRQVLRQAIRDRGSTIRNYVGGSGLQGHFQQRLQVYGRSRQPCCRCQTPLQRGRWAGRSSHYCPRCQT
jgi:formamidopyrimidine-DNA glycosylase